MSKRPAQGNPVRRNRSRAFDDTPVVVPLSTSHHVVDAPSNNTLPQLHPATGVLSLVSGAPHVNIVDSTMFSSVSRHPRRACRDASATVTSYSASDPSAPGPATPESWGMTQHVAPPSIITSLQLLSRQQWHTHTGHMWGSRHRDSCDARMVLPIPHLPLSLVRSISTWLSGEVRDNVTDPRARAILDRSTSQMAVDLQNSGVGFCPPRCGGLGLHRDADDGFTLLIALDPVFTSGGSLAFYPHSEHIVVSSGITRSADIQSRCLYEPHTVTGPAGTAWLFPSATLHWGRGNVVPNNWRIVFNAVLGSTFVNSVDSIRL